MINYQEILNKNLTKVFIEILKNIEKNGLKDGNHLYITFITNHPSVSLPNWLLKKYPEEIMCEFVRFLISLSALISALQFI